MNTTFLNPILTAISIIMNNSLYLRGFYCYDAFEIAHGCGTIILLIIPWQIELCDPKQQTDTVKEWWERRRGRGTMMWDERLR